MTPGQILSASTICAVLAVGAAICVNDPTAIGERFGAAAAQDEREIKERQLKERQEKERFEKVEVGRAVGYVTPFGLMEEHLGEKPIKGAPFSAQVVIENTQTLANGVHISNKATGMLYRDSEGRTRREQPRDGSPEIVLINDPIAGVLYRLHMFDQTVVKIAYPSSERVEQERREVELKRGAEERTIALRRKIEASGITEGQRAEDRELGRERKVEALGTQMFEGVQASGTRVTLTIAAGREGNDRPYDIVSERWYSPDLQMVVMTRQSDPRSGDKTFKLANITLGEPARSLFEPAPNFRMKEEKVEERHK